MQKYVYFFGGRQTEGNGALKELLGNKGAQLAEMSLIGINVPIGFTITTEACHYFQRTGAHPPELDFQIRENIKRIARIMKLEFGSPTNPLLFSVRSGAPVSMPGMMNTVLNLGINDEIIEGLAKKFNDRRFALDCYRRFLQMFGDVVLALPAEELEEVLESRKKERGIKLDVELKVEDLEEIIGRLKNKIEKLTGKPISQDPWEQLWMAIDAVFKSWNNPRAIAYRKINKIPEHWGTGVNVQAMVFGNLNDNSATGVMFTRNPANGDKEIYGEFLIKAQGEDIVAGIRTPYSIRKDQSRNVSQPSLEETMPKIYHELDGIVRKLERRYKEMEDVEFTVEDGKLWILQTRHGKRTASAAVKIAMDMVKEGLIDKKEALLQINSASIETFFRPTFDPVAKKEILTKGLPASPGAAVGEVVFDSGEAEKLVDAGHKVILVRDETSPDDIHGMAAAEGILTAKGGATSHAALVSRGMGKPCIVGAEEIFVDYKNQEFLAAERKIKKGEIISMDGTLGEVYLGKLATVSAQVPGDLKEILNWADEERKLGVYGNADTSEQAKQARELGAEGIGLCRTEHMFFKEERIPVFRQMILARNEDERRQALEKIKPLQKGDFLEIFQAMEGFPVIIRLLDPPLHEFLPQNEEDIERFSKQSGLSKEAIIQKVESLKELNPMLGHRGCRLGITYPEIYEMQVQAIIEAACYLKKEGKHVKLEIMIPLTLDLRELEVLKELIKKTAKEILDKEKVDLDYKIGTMIELPRAALLAGDIAKSAEFFSFGTNDLTQMTLGISRDDAGRFLPKYLEKKIFSDDPFVSIDEVGVGELIKIAVERGRKTKQDLEIGICGEHGGDPRSIEFCHKIGLDYVSCSPFRIATSRLAAAQAALRK